MRGYITWTSYIIFRLTRHVDSNIRYIHQNTTSSVLVWGPCTKTQPLFWCQREVWINVMCHPVVCKVQCRGHFVINLWPTEHRGNMFCLYSEHMTHVISCTSVCYHFYPTFNQGSGCRTTWASTRCCTASTISTPPSPSTTWPARPSRGTPCGTSPRDLTYMTSAKYLDFWTPPVPLVRIW